MSTPATVEDLANLLKDQPKPRLMNVRLQGDGKPGGTKVIDLATGEVINFVQSISFKLEAPGRSLGAIGVMEVLVRVQEMDVEMQALELKIGD